MENFKWKEERSHGKQHLYSIVSCGMRKNIFSKMCDLSPADPVLYGEGARKTSKKTYDRMSADVTCRNGSKNKNENKVNF